MITSHFHQRNYIKPYKNPTHTIGVFTQTENSEI